MMAEVLAETGPCDKSFAPVLAPAKLL